MSSSKNDSQPLGIENAMDLLIVLLYAPGKDNKQAEPIKGITKLQKLMFLLQQGVGPKQLVRDADAYGFKGYKMGPYAPQIVKDLEELQSAGIIAAERLDYLLPDDKDSQPSAPDDWEQLKPKTKRVESLKYSLTEVLGLDIGKELWESLSPRDRNEITEFKTFFNSLSLRQLLIFTYERFPAWTTESTIKEQLGLT